MDMEINHQSSGFEETTTHQPRGNSNQIAHLVAVVSSKGGVGKSFVTGLLANGLARAGYKVGILDADFTGSTIPMLFGLQGPAKAGQYSFIPLESSGGVKIISTNLLFEKEDHSVIWKETLMGQVIEQLWKEVEWGTLDFLLVDMPPATSEVAVAVMQTLPFSGALIVTSPQSITARIVYRTVNILQSLKMAVLGIVENFSCYQKDGEKDMIFGQSRVESVANLAKAPILACLPLDPQASKLCDQGKIEDVMLESLAEITASFHDALLEFGKKRDVADSNAKSAAGGSPFSDIVLGLIRSRENVGALEDPDAQGMFLGSCGDRMQIDLRISGGIISEAKFVADGCGATLACGSMITRMACSKSLEDARRISSEELLSALGGLPDDHLHCAELAVMTLREAVIDAKEGHKNLNGVENAVR